MAGDGTPDPPEASPILSAQTASIACAAASIVLLAVALLSFGWSTGPPALGLWYPAGMAVCGAAFAGLAVVWKLRARLAPAVK